MTKVIASIASWPPRIKYVEACIRSLLDQSRPLDEIDLNLSHTEFPDGVDSLPDGLRQLITDNYVHVNWEEGNTYCFRKEIPAVKRHIGTDCIMLSCDDDYIYGHEYVERMVSHLGDYDAFCSERGVVGNRAAYNMRIFGPDFWEKLNQEVIDAGISDTWMAVYLLDHKAKCLWQPSEDIDSIMRDNGDAPVTDTNAQRIGGYTAQRQQHAYDVTVKALRG